jgi:hypothetical protein
MIWILVQVVVTGRGMLAYRSCGEFADIESVVVRQRMQTLMVVVATGVVTPRVVMWQGTRVRGRFVLVQAVV